MALGEKNLFLSYRFDPPRFELRKLKFVMFEARESTLDPSTARDPASDLKPWFNFGDALGEPWEAFEAILDLGFF